MSGPTPIREWFRDWFGEEYISLYPHRDESEAKAAVDLFLAAVPQGPRAKVLDLACGAGRHMRELRAAGLQATGLDLSSALLRRAHSQAPVDPLVRADMREIPFEDGAFDALTSFFTSFGYFREPLDDRRVLGEMRRVVRRGGAFMLDFLNADRVRRELVPEDTRELDGKRIIQRREILDGCVIKRIRIESTTDGSARDFEERVRLYSRGEITALLEEAGLEIRHRFGDYEGAAFGSASPRLILAGRVTGPPEAAR